MAGIGQARNNLSSQAQKKAKSDDARIASLEKRISLIESLDPSKQLNRLATSVGNSSILGVPVGLTAAGRDAGLGMILPAVNLRYDWVAIQLQATVVYVGSVPTPNTFNNINLAIYDKASGFAIDSITNDTVAPPSGAFSNSVTLVTYARTSQFTGNGEWYADFSTLASGYTGVSEMIYQLTGSVIHFKDSA